MKTLGIIPARGGSKGVPRKNIRALGDRPLIAYSIEAAQQSRITRTIVSTDDEEIAEVARSHGAEVPFLRPAELATDTASSLSAVLHALDYAEREQGFRPDLVALLQPTSPFRTGAHINAAIDLLERSPAQSVLGLSEVDRHPYVMFSMSADSGLSDFVKLEGPRPLRRQDFPPLYAINGALYLTRRAYYDNRADPDPVFDGSSLKGLQMDRVSSVDIDSEFDLALATALLPEWRRAQAR